MVLSLEFLLPPSFSSGFLNILLSLGAGALKEKTGKINNSKTQKLSHKVISMFKHFAELNSANRALARTVSYFMYELSNPWLML